MWCIYWHTSAFDLPTHYGASYKQFNRDILSALYENFIKILARIICEGIHRKCISVVNGVGLYKWVYMLQVLVDRRSVPFDFCSCGYTYELQFAASPFIAVLHSQV